MALPPFITLSASVSRLKTWVATGHIALVFATENQRMSSPRPYVAHAHPCFTNHPVSGFRRFPEASRRPQNTNQEPTKCGHTHSARCVAKNSARIHHSQVKPAPLSPLHRLSHPVRGDSSLSPPLQRCNKKKEKMSENSRSLRPARRDRPLFGGHRHVPLTDRLSRRPA